MADYTSRSIHRLREEPGLPNYRSIFNQEPLRRRLSHRLALLACLAICACLPMEAQIVNPTDTVSPPTEGVGHDYLKMLNETVNPENGAVNLRIQVPVPAGRQITAPFSVNYNSNQTLVLTGAWQTGWGAEFLPNYGALTLGGWSYGVPNISRIYTVFPAQSMYNPVTGGPTLPPDGSTSCGHTTGYNFTDASGADHPFNLSYMYNNFIYTADGVNYPVDQACLQSGYENQQYYAADDMYQAGLTNLPPTPPGPPTPFTAPSYGDGTILVAGADGTVYSFSGYFNCNTVTETGGCSVLGSVEDRNGNELGFAQTGVNTPGVEYTDTAGRSVISAPNFGVNGSTISASGMTTPYMLTWTPQAYSGYSLNENESNTSGQCPTGAFGTGAQNQPAITEISLPNGRSYQFTYDPQYGTLSKVTYPAGGSISYTYGINPLSSSVTFNGKGQYFENPTGSPEPVIPLPNACGAEVDNVVVAHRYVYFSGGTLAQQQDFSYGPTTWNGMLWTSKTTTVKTTDWLRGGTAFNTVYTYAGLMGGNSTASSPVAVETSIVTYDTNGTVLKTVTKGWYDQFELACEVDTVGPSGPSTATFYTYGPGLQITDKKEYDFGLVTAASCPGFWGISASQPTAPSQPTITPSRETKIAYQAFGKTVFPNNIVGVQPTSSLFDRPCQEIVYNSSGTRVSETDYLYDGGTAVCGTPGTPSVTAASTPSGTHDETNFGSASKLSRGNVTEKINRCFPLAPATQSCQDSTTTYSYDETGQLLSKTDPCGNSSCSDIASAGAGYTTTYSYTDQSNGEPNAAGNSNAYVTNIKFPAVNVAHQENFYYNYETGYVTSSADENGRSTAYEYVDPLNRPTQVNDPDGGETTISYNDSVPSVTTSKVVNSSNTLETSVATMDGMGHVTETELTSDPDGADIVNTTYDGMGRVWTKTNPYRSTSDPTYGIATLYYDALGRQIKEIEADQTSVLQTCYNGVASTPSVANCSSLISPNSTAGSVTGTWVDSTDENGNHWQRASDAFGRLTQVVEPNGAAQAPSMITKYNYDGLSDLVSVTQNGISGTDIARTRSFTYDSLGQLLQSYNPETSYVCYGTTAGAAANGSNCTPGYDVNGNLGAKTDARGVTVSYNYDTLNRLFQKTYSAGSTSTSDPTACMQYDVAGSASPDANPIGNLTMEWTQAAGSTCSGPNKPLSAPPTTAVTSTELSHDAMGRTAGEAQCPLTANCTTPYPFSYSYDAAGDVIGANNGIPGTSTTLPPVSWGSIFDGAGRLDHTWIQSQPSSWSTSTYLSAPTLVQANANTGYDPLGHLVNAGLGISSANTNGVVSIARKYSPRGWMNTETDNGKTSPGSGYASATFTFAGTEQSATVSGALVYDKGVFTVEIEDGINSCDQNVDYSQGSTTGLLGQTLADTLNINCAGLITANAQGAVVTVTSVVQGASFDYRIQAVLQTYKHMDFSSPSFTLTDSSGALSGGATGTLTPGTIYSYTAPVTGGYDAAGNLKSSTDLVMGAWNYTYDTLNRLQAGTPTSGLYETPTAQYACFAYDIHAHSLVEGLNSHRSSKTEPPDELSLPPPKSHKFPLASVQPTAPARPGGMFPAAGVPNVP